MENYKKKEQVGKALKMNTGKYKSLLIMVLRVFFAVLLGHFAGHFLIWTLPIDEGNLFNEIASILLSVGIFHMLRARHWRFWIAVVVGYVLWMFARGVNVYVDPIEDPVSGHARFYGIPLPERRMDADSTMYSIIFDGKPGRAFINLCFWCFLVYALFIVPRIAGWFKTHWRVHRKRLVAVASALVVAVALVCVFRQEIAANWLVPRDWQSPYGHMRLRKEQWPKRTGWQLLSSFF